MRYLLDTCVIVDFLLVTIGFWRHLVMFAAKNPVSIRSLRLVDLHQCLEAGMIA